MIRPNIKPRTLLAITFIAVQAGCKSDSPAAPIDQISHIVPLGSLDYTGTVGTIVSRRRQCG